jgi:hypothetical protein
MSDKDKPLEQKEFRTTHNVLLIENRLGDKICQSHSGNRLSDTNSYVDERDMNAGPSLKKEIFLFLFLLWSIMLGMEQAPADGNVHNMYCGRYQRQK